MNCVTRSMQLVLTTMILAILTSCTFGQTVSPTPTTVDIEAVKTAAAATAIVELTQIAGVASPTLAPTQTSAPTATLQTPAQPANLTEDPALPTATTGGAAGLPVVETPLSQTPLPPMAGTPAAIPSATPLLPFVTRDPGPTCLNSKFVEDISIPDGTVIKPGEKFTKIWRVQNTGTCAWGQGFGIVLWAGPSMSASPQYFSYRDRPVQPGGIIDFYVEMRAPYEEGEYIAHWVMVSDSGKTFGGDFTVVIKVVK